MKIIDPHVDIADLCATFKTSEDEFINGKSDAPVDLPKLIESDIEFVGSTLYFDESYVKNDFYDGVKQYYKFYQDLLSKTDKLKEIKSLEDIESKKDNQIGMFYSIEGLECLRTSEDFFEFYDMGVKIWGLTWSYNNDYASSTQADTDLGLTEKGKSFFKEMKNHKIIIDAAHLSEKSFKDLDKHYDGTIINTHSNVKKIWNTDHNSSDYQISAIAERDGVICLFLVAGDIGENGTFEELFKHFEYIVNNWGIEYVSFCSDIYPLPEYPFVNNAKDITIMRDLKEFLLTRLTSAEVEKIMHGNFLRVLKNNF